MGYKCIIVQSLCTRWGINASFISYLNTKTQNQRKMKQEHTPGPWAADEFGYIKADSQQIADVYVYDSNNCMDCGQCECHSARNEPKLPYKANAKLMAAAPEMKEELKECRKILKHLTFYYENALGERIQTLESRLVNIELLLTKIEGDE